MIIGSTKGGVPIPNKNNTSMAFGGGVVITSDCTGLTGSTSSITSGAIRATKLTTTSSFTADKIKATLSSVSGSVKFSLYSDDSDSPDALLATTGSKTAQNGEKGYDLSSPYEVSNDTDYWISIQTSSDTPSIVSGSGGARANAYNASTEFSSTPDPYPSPNYDTSGFQFCISN